MIREEIQIVRRRLDDYSSYKVLAKEADRKLLETQVLIDAAGEPQSPKWGSVPTQNHIELSSRLNELVSDQMEYERDARRYHERLEAIEDYIAFTFEGEVKRIMRLHYLEGYPFDEMDELTGFSPSGMKMMIYRAMEATEFKQAARLF